MFWNVLIHKVQCECLTQSSVQEQPCGEWGSAHGSLHCVVTYNYSVCHSATIDRAKKDKFHACIGSFIIWMWLRFMVSVLHHYCAMDKIHTDTDTHLASCLSCSCVTIIDCCVIADRGRTADEQRHWWSFLDEEDMQTIDFKRKYSIMNYLIIFFFFIFFLFLFLGGKNADLASCKK